MFKILTHFLFIVLLFSIQVMFSQTVKGKIVDVNNEPIAYANVQVGKTGILSNEEGLFSLVMDRYKPTDSVKLSYLGYKDLKFRVKEFVSKNYILEEEINDLSEVYLSNKKWSLEDILLKIKENLSNNYSDTYTKQQVFDRNSVSSTFKKFDISFTKSTLLNKKQLKNINESIDSLIVENVNKTSKNYSESLNEIYISNDSAKLKVLKAIELVNKKKNKSQDVFDEFILKVVINQLDKDATYKVKSGFFTVEDSLKIDATTKLYQDSAKIIYKKRYLDKVIKRYTFKKNSSLEFIIKMEKYNYELKGLSEYDDELIYIINFKPKKSSAKFVGTMYVNSHDFAVVKLDFKYGEGKSGQSANLKFLLGVKFKEHTWKSSVMYKKNADDKYRLQFIKQTRGTYVYMKRPFKFKKNRANKEEAKKIIKMEVLMEQNTYSTTELFFISGESISDKVFKEIDQKSKYKVHYVPKYTNSIWEGYNVLSPVEDIKNYDTGL